uniref:Uncharacterized protein n=1 Tax=Cryptomonas curvata TaxID=233186 RepID=A0A7S0MI74_9CRYP|mmetsp:Transcript_41277/g.86194  ORF Transcript_41277/g.86194 Transcript_41277/m.86194 type:complete len:736 (+) Transcript_41277:810-3017(+)
MSRRHPATPLSCRGNQALAAGSETRRRSVDGCVCLRNSPRPCESRSHLSGFPSVNVGLAPPVWQWRLGGEDVNKHLSIGSQGCTTGSPAAMLPIHFGLHVALSRHPNKLVRALAIIDDISLMGDARDIGPLFLDVREVFKATCGMDLKLKKCSLLILQMHTILDPEQLLVSFYEQVPQLCCLPLVTQGTVVVGVPIGTPQFIHQTIRKIIADCAADLAKLIPFPHGTFFLLILRYSSNQKLMYWMRTVSPDFMMEHALRFDQLVEDTFAEYFDANMAAVIPLENIIPGMPLTYPQTIQLAKHQLRDSEDKGGLGLTSMAKITIPAYYAASIGHLLNAATNASHQHPLLSKSPSAGLFTDPIIYAHAQMMATGATLLMVDPKPLAPNADPASRPAGLHLPDLDLFWNLNPQSAIPPLRKTLLAAARQHTLSKWCLQNHPSVDQLDKIRQANPSQRARLAHLCEQEVKGSHDRFDIPPTQTIRHRPTAFLGNLLPTSAEGLSKYQLSLYLKLILGLPFSSPPGLMGYCACGQPHDITGAHMLNCNKWAGRSWGKGHDVVVAAIAFESRRLGHSVVDIDAAMKKKCTHLKSQKRGDMLVRSKDIEITDRAKGHGISRTQFVLDVKIVAMLDGKGVMKTGMPIKVNLTIPEWSKLRLKNFANMRNRMLRLDSVFSLLLAPVLVPLVSQQCATCGLLLGWNSVRMLQLAVPKALTLWMIQNLLSFVPVAIATALPDLELR